MAQAPTATPPQALPTDVVGGALACVRCGYGLRGLPVAGVCPECAGPIARSLHGDLLRFAAPGYLRTLRVGALLAEAGVIGMIVSIIGGMGWLIWDTLAGSGGAQRTAWGVLGALGAIGAACAVLTLAGWLMLSAPDPARLGVDVGVTSRKLLRASLGVGAAAWLGLAALSMPRAIVSISPAMYLPISKGLGIVAGVSVLAQLLFAAAYARTLGVRLARPSLSRDAVRLRRTTVACVACCGYVAVLAATTRSAEMAVLVFAGLAYALLGAAAAKYANVLDVARRELGKAAREAAEDAAVSGAAGDGRPVTPAR